MATISLLRLRTPKVTSAGNKDSKRRDGIDHAGGEIEQICADRRECNVIANDVSNEFEKCENQHEHDEAGQHQYEHPEELAHDIGIEQAREKPARNNADGAGLEPLEQAPSDVLHSP